MKLPGCIMKKKKPTMLVITKGEKNVNSSEVIDLDKGKVK